MGRKARESRELLAPLTNLEVGDVLHTSPLLRLMCVLPQGETETGPVDLNGVHLEHLLANLVALLNAPERQWQASLLAIGISPTSKRAVGISMNYNDQDSFRIGFDTSIGRRIRPCPTANCFRIHFLPLKKTEEKMQPQTREELLKLQKVRQPTLIGETFQGLESSVQRNLELATMSRSKRRFSV